MTYDDRDTVVLREGQRLWPTAREKALRPKDPARQKLNRNNRRRGKTAQAEWAEIIHGRNVGILGREDVDDGIRLWEVKHRKLPAWIREAFAQVDRHVGPELRYVVIKHSQPGKPAEWWVVQPAAQFIETCGLGLYETKKALRR